MILAQGMHEDDKPMGVMPWLIIAIERDLGMARVATAMIRLR